MLLNLWQRSVRKDVLAPENEIILCQVAICSVVEVSLHDRCDYAFLPRTQWAPSALGTVAAQGRSATSSEMLSATQASGDVGTARWWQRGPKVGGKDFVEQGSQPQHS